MHGTTQPQLKGDPVNFKSITLATMLGAALAPAHALMVTSTAGAVTTYTENFNSGSSFIGGSLGGGSDKYLELTPSSIFSSSPSVATFAFSSVYALTSLSLSFWYSTVSGNSGDVSLVTLTRDLNDTTPSFLFSSSQFQSSNPGNVDNPYDARFPGSVTSLPDGMNNRYTLTLSGTGLRVDDVVITAAIPEPETYALILGGLGIVGFVARRRRPQGY